MMRSRYEMPISRIVKTLHSKSDLPLCASIFEKLAADGTLHYGCRMFRNGKFARDEFYPQKSLSYVEVIAKKWTEGELR
jgi:hypothetical protein